MKDEVTNAKQGSDEFRKINPRLTLLLGTIGSILMAVATPFFYLNGKAYHDGYISYFNLDSSMFSLDVSATFVASLMGWMNVSVLSVAGIMKFVGSNLLLVGVGYVVSVAGFGALNYLLKKYQKKNIRGSEGRDAKRSGPYFFDELFKASLLFFVPGYVVFALMLFIACAILISVVPFVHVGQLEAAKDLQKEFASSPVVRVADYRGSVGEYRLMLCSVSFCALYRQGEVVTIPQSAINMAVSDVRDKLVEGRKKK